MITTPRQRMRARSASTATRIDPLLRHADDTPEAAIPGFDPADPYVTSEFGDASGFSDFGESGHPGDGAPPAPVPSSPTLWQRWRRQWRRWRTVRRRAILILVILMLPIVWSYYRALTGPGSDSLQARTVEWARDNHLGWVVDRTEKWWYANHQAKVGGTPNLANGPVVAPETSASASTAATGSTASTAATTPGDGGAPATTPGGAAAPLGNVSPVPADGGAASADTAGDVSTTHLVPPTRLASPAGASAGREGQWQPFGPTVNGVQGAYVTSIRPDAVHTSILDAVVWIDPTVLKLRQYPGLKIPGSPWDRPPYVETNRQAQLVAAFDGGFRIQDSRGGMILGHQVLKPMRTGGATFAISDSGVPNIGAWGTDITNGPTLDSARQSLDLIVINGAPNPALQSDPNRTWGFTGPANKTAVWRSGAGIRADGSLVWVGGDGLTVESLADTLVRAGAIRGMQLDINHEWVQLNTYAVDSTGAVHGRKLLSGMQHTGDRWLTEDTRDFIAIFTRP